MTETRAAICRLCSAYCPIEVTLEDGRAVRVVGNRRSPLYGGYTCPKGRALPEQHVHSNRLLTSRKRDVDGSLTAFSSERALDEVADRVATILAE